LFQIEAVIFDLGRVLVNVDFTRGLFKYYHNSLKENDSETIDRLFNDKLFIQFTTGKISPPELYREIVKRFKINLEYKDFVKEWCNVFEPMDGVVNLVQEVAQNYVVGLLSDTDPLHWEYCLNTFPFLRIFSKPTLSYEIGVLKPTPLCYQLAAANVGKSIANCLFIDDRAINVRGAKEVGMQAILYKNIAQLRRDLLELGILKR